MCNTACNPERRQAQACSVAVLTCCSLLLSSPAVLPSALQSAAVLGLSRLVFEFAGQLEGVVSRLLPAVLMLLRSHSREVIKAVLGFIKVRVFVFVWVQVCVLVSCLCDAMSSPFDFAAVSRMLVVWCRQGLPQSIFK